jgi:signal transduction histidine kinase
MKIKTKLSLLFTLVITLMLIALNLYIYSLSKSFASSDFFSRLRQRVYAAANVYLEEDEVSKKKFQEFQVKFLEKLPDEVVRFYDIHNQPAFIEDSNQPAFPVSVIERTRKEKVYRNKDHGIYTYGIFYSDNQGDFVILISADDKSGDVKLKHLGSILILGFFLNLIVLYFIGGIFTKRMLTPISDIITHVNSITDTNLDLRLNEGNGKDELAELAITFNKMLERLGNSFKLQQNFVASASHELRTPLTSIIGNIEVLLSRQRSADEYKIVLNTVLEEAERLHKLSDGLLNIAQASSDIRTISMERLRIDELLEESIKSVQSQMPESKMDLYFENMPENSEELFVTGNRHLLSIAFENVIENANKFSDNKKVKICLDNSPAMIIISTTDSGIGIPEKDVEKIFQTFYRSENALSFNGSGVGLSLCEKIINLHRGLITIKSAVGQGTTITIMLKKA